MNSKTIGVIALAAVVSLGIGFAIGTSLNKPGINVDSNNSNIPVSDLSEKSVEELGVQLSDIMLPKEEYDKLGGAILQSGMGLFMAQAQGAGLTVDEKATEELKKRIDEKYTRKYFTDQNAVSMKELNKEDLVAILSFYNTTAGQKFLKLSPQIIESTMTAVQNDLQQWLPATVTEVIGKLKTGGTNGSAPAQGNNEAPVEAPKEGSKG